MARTKLKKRVQWQANFTEDPLYPFPQFSTPPDSINTTADMPTRPVVKPTTKSSFGQLKARYRDAG